MATTELVGAGASHERQVADGIYRLGDRYDSWYLIDDAGRLALVDTGLPAHWDQLTALLETLGRSIEDIEAVLLTHSHLDHLGNAARIRSTGRARMLVHKADADDARKGGGAPPMSAGVLRSLVRPTVIRYMAHTARAGGLRKHPIDRISVFQDGDRLDVPGAPLVIHMPGHTPGECAFLLDRRDALLSGDALVTLDIAPAYTGPTLLTTPFVLNPSQALASLGRLETVAASTLLPGHGEPWRHGVAEAVRLARTHAG